MEDFTSLRLDVPYGNRCSGLQEKGLLHRHIREDKEIKFPDTAGRMAQFYDCIQLSFKAVPIIFQAEEEALTTTLKAGVICLGISFEVFI